MSDYFDDSEEENYRDTETYKKFSRDVKRIVREIIKKEQQRLKKAKKSKKVSTK